MGVRRGFTLVELLVVIGIIVLLAAVLLPAITGLIGNRDKAVSLGLVRSLKLSLDAYKLDQGFYPEPPAGDGLKLDFEEDGNLLADLNERYDLVLDNQFMINQVFCDVWSNPLQYVKGDYANRIAKKDLTETSLPQDTNKPKAADIPAAESDWNRDNRGAYAYVWSYGEDGPDGDGSTWLYIADE